MIEWGILITINIIVLGYLWLRKPLKPIEEILLDIPLPDTGREDCITPYQEKALNEWGFPRFFGISQKHATLVISCIRFSENIWALSLVEGKLTNKRMEVFVRFILSDGAFRDYVRIRSASLWKRGLNEVDAGLAKNEYFYKLKNLMEKESG